MENRPVLSQRIIYSYFLTYSRRYGIICVYLGISFPVNQYILFLARVLFIYKVDALRANYSGTSVALTDICLKPLGDDCATQSILQVIPYYLCNYKVWHVSQSFQKDLSAILSNITYYYCSHIFFTLYDSVYGSTIRWTLKISIVLEVWIMLNTVSRYRL